MRLARGWFTLTTRQVAVAFGAPIGGVLFRYEWPMDKAHLSDVVM